MDPYHNSPNFSGGFNEEQWSNHSNHSDEEEKHFSNKNSNSDEIDEVQVINPGDYVLGPQKPRTVCKGIKNKYNNGNRRLGRTPVV